MVRALSRVLLIGSLMYGAACDTEPPTAPRPIPPPPTVNEPPTPAPPPPGAGKLVATYAYSEPLDYPVRPYTTQTEFQLYDNGVFGLLYKTNSFMHPGTYFQDGGTITFRFGSEIATGTLKGDLMEVRYSDIMVQSDFENAVYRRAQ